MSMPGMGSEVVVANAAATRRNEDVEASRRGGEIYLAPSATSAAAAIEGGASAIISDMDVDRDTDRDRKQHAQVQVVKSDDDVAMSAPAPRSVGTAGLGCLGWGCHTIMLQHCARIEARNVAARR
jgi:hypothetical protein